MDCFEGPKKLSLASNICFTFVQAESLDMMSEQVPAKVASSVCVPCRQRKRKCDKLLPTCSSCARLPRLCRYEEKVEVAKNSRQPLGIDSAQWTAPIFEVLYNLESTSIPQTNTLQISVNDVVVEQMYKVFGDLEKLKLVTQLYFRTIHSWIQFISKPLFFSRVQNLWNKPRADLALLAISMQLITERPDSSVTMAQSSTYVLIKMLCSLLESAGIISLEFLQAKLLICLFELGHGIQPAAFLTIGFAARCGIILGIDKRLASAASDNPSQWLRHEEEKRVWWAVIIMDRWVNLLAGSHNFAAEDPSSGDFLPVDDNMWDLNIHPGKDPLPLETPSSMRVGTFARQAQVAHILRRTLTHVYKTTEDHDFNHEEARQLFDILLTLSDLLPKEAAETLNVFCGAIGICNSTLVFLHRAHSDTVSDHQKFCSFKLDQVEDMCKNVVELARFFDEAKGSIGVDTLTPFIPYAIYDIATIYTSIAGGRQGPEYEIVLLLKSMLYQFGQRWDIASIFLRRLEGEDKSDYSVGKISNLLKESYFVV
ncbi:hypothetical protein F5884DRAFT_889103 [Xylogone sp. PMI_703]|nr:hypothetical protein F5884DRAFT_889103 [Xylogone sp. PMI_703]